jgi:hypothetical protein
MTRRELRLLLLLLRSPLPLLLLLHGGKLLWRHARRQLHLWRRHSRR